MTTVEQHSVLLDAWRAKQKQIAVLRAEAAALLSERLVVLDAEIAESPFHRDAIERSMIAEFAAAGRMARGAVDHAFSDARVLAELPAVRASFAAGLVSAAHVREIVRASDGVSEAVREGRVEADTMSVYEAAVLEVAERDSPSRTRAHARQVATMLAQETVRERHARAREERTVSVRSVGDGLAMLEVLLPEELAVAIMDRLTRMARHQRSGGAEREPTLPVIDDEGLADDQDLFDLSDERLAQFFAAARWQADEDPGEEDPGEDASHEPTATEPPAADERAAAAAEGGPEEPLAPDAVQELLAIFDANPYRPPDDRAQVPLPPDPLLHPASACIIRIPGDHRTLDQIRADLLTDLLLTTDPSTAHGTAWERITAHVQVTVRASTLSDADELCAELDGHGPLLPDSARALAAHNTGWTRLFLNPRGMVTETDTYTPTEGMRRHLRARDQHCRFPGCRMPVHRCDIDHNHDHALGGSTALENLAHLCKTHHALKHPHVSAPARWSARTLADWSLEWTSPTGRTYTDHPTHRVAFT